MFAAYIESTKLNSNFQFRILIPYLPTYENIANETVTFLYEIKDKS